MVLIESIKSQRKINMFILTLILLLQLVWFARNFFQLFLFIFFIYSFDSIWFDLILLYWFFFSWAIFRFFHAAIAIKIPKMKWTLAPAAMFQSLNLLAAISFGLIRWRILPSGVSRPDERARAPEWSKRNGGRNGPRKSNAIAEAMMPENARWKIEISTSGGVEDRAECQRSRLNKKSLALKRRKKKKKIKWEKSE